jgi:hypothetical protein
MRAAAGWISIVLGLGFGIPCLFAIQHLSDTGEVWTFMGFPTYGGGPFETAGIQTTVGLLVAFLFVCVAEVVAGVLVISGAPHASLVSYLLLPVAMVFWIGFALPVGPPLGIASAVLLYLSRS